MNGLFKELQENKYELFRDVLCAAIEYVVEGTPFQEVLEKRGRTIDDCLGLVVSQQHSSREIAGFMRNYLEEVIAEAYGPTPEKGFIGKERVSQAYVVKKIICEPDDYNAFAEAVSDESTKKLHVIRIIGNARNESAKDIIGLKTLNKVGYEMNLIRAYSPEEAIRNSKEKGIAFRFTSEEEAITPKVAKIMDEVGMTLFSTYDLNEVARIVTRMEIQELIDSGEPLNIPL